MRPTRTVALTPTPLSPCFCACAGGDSAAAGARFPSSKLKLDELFLNWLSLPESQKLARCAAALLRAAPGSSF
jgi:hypothetical protein